MITSQHRKREGNRHFCTSTGCETSSNWKPLVLAWAARANSTVVHGTHTEAQSSVGLSIPDTKDQGALAGMHFPTAAVVRPAQRSVIGIIGARQRVLNGGDDMEQPAPTDKSAVAMQIHRMSVDMKRHNKEVYSVYKTHMQCNTNTLHRAGLVGFGELNNRSLNHPNVHNGEYTWIVLVALH